MGTLVILIVQSSKPRAGELRIYLESKWRKETGQVLFNWSAFGGWIKCLSAQMTSSLSQQVFYCGSGSLSFSEKLCRGIPERIAGIPTQKVQNIQGRGTVFESRPAKEFNRLDK